MNTEEAVKKLRWLAVFGYRGCDNRVSKDDVLNIAYLIEEQEKSNKAWADESLHSLIRTVLEKEIDRKKLKDAVVAAQVMVDRQKRKIRDLEKNLAGEYWPKQEDAPRTIHVKPGDKIISPDGTEATFVKWGLM